jgi:hypothetical protein
MEGEREIYGLFESSRSGEALKTMEIVYEPLADWTPPECTSTSA